MRQANIYSPQTTIHAFCVSCGHPVWAMTGVGQTADMILKVAPNCGCDPHTNNLNENGLRVWHANVVEGLPKSWFTLRDSR